VVVSRRVDSCCRVEGSDPTVWCVRGDNRRHGHRFVLLFLVDEPATIRRFAFARKRLRWLGRKGRCMGRVVEEGAAKDSDRAGSRCMGVDKTRTAKAKAKGIGQVCQSSGLEMMWWSPLYILGILLDSIRFDSTRRTTGGGNDAIRAPMIEVLASWTNGQKRNDRRLFPIRAPQQKRNAGHEFFHVLPHPSRPVTTGQDKSALE
jgi:hypothetical protein